MSKFINVLIEFYVHNRLAPKTIAEAEAAKLYVHAMKDARFAVIGLIGFLVALISLVVGFVLLVLGFVATTAVNPLAAVSSTALVLGIFLFLIPLFGLTFGLSQRFLVRASRIDQVVKKVELDSREVTAGGTPSMNRPVPT